MSWGDQVSEANKRVVQRVSAIHRALILKAFSEVIKLTPVDTGRAKGNWQVTIGQPATGTVDIEDKTPLKQISGTKETEIKNQTKNIQLDETAWLSNNLPYIEFLEYGRGDSGESGSKQAPRGMLRVVVARYEQFLREARKEVDK